MLRYNVQRFNECIYRVDVYAMDYYCIVTSSTLELHVFLI